MGKKFYIFILVLIAFFGIKTVAYGQVNPPNEPPNEVPEESESLGNIWQDLRWGIEQILHPVVEILLPIPVQLGLGVNPRPEPVFDSGSNQNEEESQRRVLGTEKQRESAVLFFRDLGDGAKVYSLTGNFYSNNEGKTPLVKPGSQMTETKSRSEIWGARAARVEEEIRNCFHDSGVILSLLGLASLALVVAVVAIVTKMVVRKS